MNVRKHLKVQAHFNRFHLLNSNTNFADFFKTTLKILRKPVILLMLLNTFTLILGVSGTMSFQMKYIENQYDMPTYQISLYLGELITTTVIASIYN